ncbi:MAG: hypothetical protein A2846_03280 [Candidatus Doudnabacteria bacterium RIFCSPHIGHO2_01_FULL_49_9]|uniref:EamA domain-containing protein n=1 Tax=Candidatus Doudnabacteria bacterium RIFCSPHIGHO2_01_FULL_49_9 TaxID=1817827 RepID=A0A1F5NYC8_9BACT|nr:MAG: hypothetical protein A2846_03280 [Candidatus Doudnabacteria bacterium RIFCSPHIGHO2_01_FULL_49_9]
MFGVILTSIGTFFTEVSVLIGKRQAREGHEDAYALGFFDVFWAMVILGGIALVRQSFVFSAESLPTFTIRAILEVAQAHVTALAVIRADRSTFGFIRVFTLPLLLVIDLALGYTLSAGQMFGVTLIFLVLIMIFMSKKIGKQGRWLVLFTAVNAGATISLFKYDITHFNSVEAEQILILAILLVYFWAGGLAVSRQNNLARLFTRKIFFAQSLAQGLATVVESFAYSFAPASIIMAAKRSSAITWSMISGHFVFSEKNFVFKITVLTALVGGIILLAI